MESHVWKGSVDFREYTSVICGTATAQLTALWIFNCLCLSSHDSYRWQTTGCFFTAWLKTNLPIHPNVLNYARWLCRWLHCLKTHFYPYLCLLWKRCKILPKYYISRCLNQMCFFCCCCFSQKDQKTAKPSVKLAHFLKMITIIWMWLQGWITDVIYR